MEDDNKGTLNEFKDMIKEQVHELKSDMSDTDSSFEIDKSEITRSVQETDENAEPIIPDLNEQAPNDIVSECLMLCGRILRVIGDEATCRACGKNLRHIGDEIFCNYATRNMLHSLLTDLSEMRATSENVR